jgi:hypothetical protein
MWTAPVPQELFWSDRIACIHMSGLLIRSVTAGQDGFRDASSKQPSDLLFGQWVPRILSHLGSIDPTIYSSCSSGLGKVREPERFANPSDLYDAAFADAIDMRAPS